LDQLRERARVSEQELRTYYNDHIELYRVQNRSRVSHILFKTVGKTDAEVAEIHKTAEEVLKKVKRGAKFEELAKQYSEDTTKDKGGDLGWIVKGQTVPEFEQVAFNLPTGATSDLVKTPYGFHVTKVVGGEAARTKSLEEVRGAILPLLTGEKADRLANEAADQITAEVRKATRGSLDDLAKKFHLTVGETRPVAPTDPVPEVGNAPELGDTLSRLRVGDLSYPVRTERGYVVLTVKEVLPAHPATLAEVRDKLLADYRHDQAVELAKTRANELAKRAQSGEALTTAAAALGLEVKTSEALTRTGSVPDVGSARQLPGAFSLEVGQTGPPTLLRANWIVYRVVAHDAAKPEEFEKQRVEIERQVLEYKRQLAFDSFHVALEERMEREGKLKIMPEYLRREIASAGSAGCR